MKNQLKLNAFLFLFIIFSGCSFFAPKLNREFTLSLNDEIEFKEERLTIKFENVLKDNRCPWDTGVSCAERGQAVVVVSVRKGEEESKLLELLDNNNPRPTEKDKRFETKTFLNYQIHLKALPYKSTNATFMVTKR